MQDKHLRMIKLTIWKQLHLCSFSFHVKSTHFFSIHVILLQLLKAFT